MACEYLLLNGAKINIQDTEGKTPLYLATTHSKSYKLFFYYRADVDARCLQEPVYIINWILRLGHTAQVCLLLKHKADQHLKDNDGTDPLTIAVAEANADIVTL